MPFVKVQKNKAYYKRIQVKYRRRKSGKTDYAARRAMVKQDKDKYNTPKYRLVVRITNKQFICQIVYSTIQGDRTLTQATSKELAKFDVPIGHTNYAAGYATGLLIARRTLKKMGLDEDFVGVEEADAEEFHIEEEGTDRRPFKVILDVGSIRTIQGSRCFSVLKGAVDGGLHIPHSIAKFPGYVGPEERGAEAQYDTSAHLDRILGRHVTEYMEMLDEEDQERYKAQFSKFLENDLTADDLEEMYKECHKKIRESPEFEKKTDEKPVNKRMGNWVECDGTKYERKVRLSKAQRKSRVAQKINAAREKLMAMADEEEEEE
jgi:large subunit ribosomal protein L5e